MKEYGYFSGKKYVITDRNIPRNWYNFMFNNEYITFISQVGFGQGFAQDEMGCRVPALMDRAVYLAEAGRFWQATGLPVQEQLEDYRCIHAIGYTDLVVKQYGIYSECRFFVPNEGKRECLRVTLRNESEETRTLKVIPYCATDIDGSYVPQGYQKDWGGFSAEKNCAFATGYSSFGSGKGHLQYVYLTSHEKLQSFDTRHNAFIGPYGNKLMPRALMEGEGCTGSDCIAEKLCLAVENTVTLAPGEEKRFYYTLGTEDALEKIPQYTSGELEEQFAEMLKKHQGVCEGVEIETPWQDLNDLFNDWLKYQTNLGSRWARVRHNGIRDLTSDTECLGCFQAELAADRLCRVMTYQYENGYAPRTFLGGKVQDNNFSDNMVWMVFAAHAITKELGDLTYLQREVPFNNGAVASVYEHAKRAVEFLWGFTGHDGLVRIWGGDWNDTMKEVGIGGKGVSVWLSIAFVRAAKMLSQMASWLGKTQDAKDAIEKAAAMEARVNEFGWDGDRYLYAISDDRYPIGAKECKEGSMFALPQLWSVLADFDEKHRTIAMDTLERELNTDLGLLVSKPPYTEPLPHIRSMAKKYPGLHENGGVYLHASVWKLAADSLLGRNDKVEEGLHKILPSHHKYYEKCGEPYAMFNSYLGEQTGYRAGTPGQSWRTASGQWLLYSLVRFIFGLQPEFEGLLLRPCLPPSWKDCAITKQFRGCRYEIRFLQKGEGACNHIEKLMVDGKEADPSLPIKPISGKTLKIEAILG